ncbi:MAG: hypothetical protein BWY85_00434 [Firmicutes bacterium ADurb.Bin506]|jgi:NAD-dependent SIR2 family protein deacetylase|nr:MAG: hypothetical protein BWY85_00434 [Firmicutes bacterium ADurb.Bin506]
MVKLRKQPGDKLTPTASGTASTFKCSSCGMMFPGPDASSGDMSCSTCPGCGQSNCTETTEMVNSSDQDY